MIQKDVVIDLAGERKPFTHFFRATGYANADYTYTPPVKKMYDCLSSYKSHPLYMRLHNFLSLHGKGDYYITQQGLDYGNPNETSYHVTSDIVVQKKADGKLFYDWQPVDTVFDIIVGHGMKPIVEAVYLPHVITLSAERHYVPENFSVWAEVITAFVKHWIERYGIEEVLDWYFEIFNEPDNIPEWLEDASSFFALYDYFEKAVHTVDSRFKVGGPAVKQWDGGKKLCREFLAHCDHGVNYCTGEYGTRLDFISVHCKGGMPDSNSPSMNYMFDPLLEYIQMIKQYPKFEKTEFINDESDIVWDGNRGVSYKSWLNFRNTHYAPGFTCKMIHTYCMVVQDEQNMNLAIVDSDNCHLPWEKSFFSGNRSQFTPLTAAPCTDLIRKPMFNAFQLLGKLGNERYTQRPDDPEFGKKYGVLATKHDDNYAIMLWNFEDGLEEDVNERLIHLTLQNLEKNAQFDVLHYCIDDSHSNAHSVWKKLGKPFPLTAEHIAVLRSKDGLELCEPSFLFASGGSFAAECTLKMHAVSLYVLVKRIGNGTTSIAENAAIDGVMLAAPKVQTEKSVLNGEQVFLTWPFSETVACTGYAVYRRENSAAEFECLNPDSPASCSFFTDSAIQKGCCYSYKYSFLYADGSESACSKESVVHI